MKADSDSYIETLAGKSLCGSGGGDSVHTNRRRGLHRASHRGVLGRVSKPEGDGGDGGLFCDDVRHSKTNIPSILVADASRGHITSVIYPLPVISPFPDQGYAGARSVEQRRFLKVVRSGSDSVGGSVPQGGPVKEQLETRGGKRANDHRWSRSSYFRR